MEDKLPNWPIPKESKKFPHKQVIYILIKASKIPINNAVLY